MRRPNLSSVAQGQHSYLPPCWVDGRRASFSFINFFTANHTTKRHLTDSGEHKPLTLMAAVQFCFCSLRHQCHYCFSWGIQTGQLTVIKNGGTQQASLWGHCGLVFSKAALSCLVLWCSYFLSSLFLIHMGPRCIVQLKRSTLTWDALDHL